MKYFLKTIIAVVSLLAVGGSAAVASDADSTECRWRHGIELSGRAAPVLRSSSMLRGENATGRGVNAAFAGDIHYTMRMPRGSHWDRYYPHAYQGAGIGFTAFSPDGLTGTPFNLYVLQGSRIASLTPALSLDYEWNFGASFGWRKISNDDPFDSSDIDGFGSKVNAYINIDFLLKYRISRHLTLVGGVGISHFSNGNTDYPNPGVNAVWARLGVAYSLGAVAPDSRADWTGFEPGMVYDVTAYGAWRRGFFDSSVATGASEPDEALVPGHFGVAGFNINPMWRFNPVLAAGASVDGQYDDCANLSPYYEPNSPVDDPRFYRQPFSHRCSLGVSLRAELTMPIFAVNVGVGHSIWAPGGPDMRGWYQTFTLKTFITKRLYLSTGYRLLRWRDPGNLMLGVGYRFGR